MPEIKSGPDGEFIYLQMNYCAVNCGRLQTLKRRTAIVTSGNFNDESFHHHLTTISNSVRTSVIKIFLSRTHDQKSVARRQTFQCAARRLYSLRSEILFRLHRLLPYRRQSHFEVCQICVHHLRRRDFRERLQQFDEFRSTPRRQFPAFTRFATDGNNTGSHAAGCGG